MTIDRDKLVELLVEKTGSSKEQVESQLSELVSRIQGAAGEGKSFEIEGFGIFSMSEGELRFDPAEELRTEINNNYAGMEPIELIGANKEESTNEPVGSGDEAADEEDPFAGLEDLEEEEEPEPETADEEDQDDIDAELDEILGLVRSSQKSPSVLGDELSKARTEKSSDEGQKPEDPEEKEMEEDPFAGLDDIEPESEVEDLVEGEHEEEKLEMEEAPASDDPDSEAIPFDFEDEFGTEKEEPQRKTKWEPAPELKGLKQTPGKKQEKDTIGSVLIVAMMVIVLGVGGWFAYDIGLLSGILGSDTGGQPQQQAVQQVPPPTQQQPEDEATAAEEQQEAAETESSTLSESVPGSQAEGTVSEPSAGNEVAGEESSQSPAAMATYGLMGTANPGANDGYTIVVHSMRSRVVAESVESALANDGYRTLLMGTVVSGNQFWRIGIGQFETVSGAQAAAGNLDEPYRSENFIRRIDN